MFFFQKARLARIQIAKATSGAAFVAKKRAAEARLAAQVNIRKEFISSSSPPALGLWFGLLPLSLTKFPNIGFLSVASR